MIWAAGQAFRFSPDSKNVVLRNRIMLEKQNRRG